MREVRLELTLSSELELVRRTREGQWLRRGPSVKARPSPCDLSMRFHLLYLGFPSALSTYPYGLSRVTTEKRLVQSLAPSKILVLLVTALCIICEGGRFLAEGTA